MGFTLDTARLRFRNRRDDASDISFFVAMFADPDVMRYTNGRTYDAAETISVLKIVDAGEEGREAWDGFKVLELKSTTEIIGWCGLRQCELDGTPGVEVGWALHPTFWRQGFATEAAQRACVYAYNELRLESIDAMIKPANSSSILVVKRLGGRHVGTVSYRMHAMTESMQIERYCISLGAAGGVANHH